jgi:hypothetical protein
MPSYLAARLKREMKIFGEASTARVADPCQPVGMNQRAPTPIPLRLDPHALAAVERRSFNRMLAAVALGKLKGCSAASIIADHWSDDAKAALLTKAAVAPTMTTTSGLPTFTAVATMPLLAPQSASVRLFERAGLTLDFAGVHAYLVPYSAPNFPQPIFVGEGAAMPMVAGDLDGMTVGPTGKIRFGTGVSEELQAYSAEAATSIIGRLMSDAARKSLDAAVFSTVPADAVRPAGLLAGVAALPATAGGGLDALTGDMKNLVGAIGDAALATDDVIIVANPRQAEALRLLPPQPFAHQVFGTAALADGTVIAIAPDALAVGYDGTPEIETTKHGTAHFESVPLPISTPGSPNMVSAPTLSAFQSGLIFLGLRLRCAWAAQPGSVQFISAVTW